MGKSNNRLGFEAHLSRHPHNVSAGFTSSLTTGPIVPQYFDVLSPGDSLYYSPTMFARFNDVTTAFLGEVDLHLDAFFVPFDMLYTLFGNIFTQTNDVISSKFKTITARDSFPVLNVTNARNYFASRLNTRVFGQECMAKNVMRLADALNLNPMFIYPNNEVFDEDEYNGYMPNFSPWLFAAYQAIYQKYYRNDELEVFDITSYNLDQYSNAENGLFFNDHLFYTRYHQRENDYFTSLRVSPLGTGINQLGKDTYSTPEISGFNEYLRKVNDWLGTDVTDLGFQESTSQNFRDYYPYTTQGLNIVDENTPLFSTTTGISCGLQTAANIRTLFAVDKFVRIFGRAGKTYDEQIKAHFGVKVPHDVKHQLTHLKSWRLVLNSEPIYSTSSSGSETGSLLGQVGGQVNGKLVGGKEKFTAPVHGIFMIVAYALTRPRYFDGISRLHFLDQRLKFPIPEFDKLGAQPLFGFEASTKSSYDGDGVPLSSILGWENRYNEFKRKYNRVSLNYRSDGGTGQYDESNIFSSWVLSSRPYQDVYGHDNVPYALIGEKFLSRDIFLQSVSSLNSVMVRGYDIDWHEEYFKKPYLMFQSDPIITEFYLDAKKVSWMSPTGEPDL